MSYEEELRVAMAATKLAGEFLEKEFDHVTTIKAKNEYKELVTDLDLKSEQIILSMLRASFPGYGIISEESPHSSEGKEYSWVVDPLDGTANLALGLPMIAVSVALQKMGETVLGVVYHPMRHRHYTGVLGGGSQLDGRAMQVSLTDAIGQAQIGHIVSYEEKYLPRALDLVTTLRGRCRRLLDTWAPSMEWTLLAQGKIDALVSLGSGVYDRLAGELIAKEAGGIVTDFQGAPVAASGSTYILASNNTLLHQAILDLVHAHYPLEMS